MKNPPDFTLIYVVPSAIIYADKTTGPKRRFKMDQNYNLNDVAMMTGFSTRTLRSYLSQGLLKGTKSNGVCRVILNGAEDQVARIMNDYHSVSNA